MIGMSSFGLRRVSHRTASVVLYGATLQISRLCFHFINDLQLRVHTHRGLNWSRQLAVSLPQARCQPPVGPLEFVFICLRRGFITQSALHNHLRAAGGADGRFWKGAHSEEGAGSRFGLYFVMFRTTYTSWGATNNQDRFNLWIYLNEKLFILHTFHFIFFQNNFFMYEWNIYSYFSINLRGVQ